MGVKLFYALLLTILPLSELRGGLPVAILYALENDFPIWLIFIIIVVLNILLIFFIFFFLDKLHHLFMRNKIYYKLFSKYVTSKQKKLDRVVKHKWGEFVALFLFVAVPLPGTGAWTGCLLAWLLGLNRKKSILAISGGIIVAGTVILLASLGLIRAFGG